VVSARFNQNRTWSHPPQPMEMYGAELQAFLCEYPINDYNELAFFAVAYHAAV